MKHFADPDFWAAYERLPPKIRTLADRNFERLKNDPAHPSLRFKQAGRYWSVRVGLHYRALAIDDGDISSGSGSAATLSMTACSGRLGRWLL